MKYLKNIGCLILGGLIVYLVFRLGSCNDTGPKQAPPDMTPSAIIIAKDTADDNRLKLHADSSDAEVLKRDSAISVYKRDLKNLRAENYSQKSDISILLDQLNNSDSATRAAYLSNVKDQVSEYFETNAKADTACDNQISELNGIVMAKNRKIFDSDMRLMNKNKTIAKLGDGRDSLINYTKYQNKLISKKKIGNLTWKGISLALVILLIKQSIK